MTTKTGSDIVDTCNTVVNDNATKWAYETWRLYINNGQVLIAEIFPDAFTVDSAIQLSPGVYQSIPSDGIKFMSLRNNAGSDGTTQGNAITLTDEETLSAFVPDWASSSRASVTVENYMFDENIPTAFKVFPSVPASPNVFVNMTYAKYPDELAGIGATLSIPDRFVPALVEYCLYMALSAETDARDPNKANQHLSSFYNLLGVKAKNRVKYSPNIHEKAGTPAADATIG